VARKKELGRVIELDDALADRGDEESSEDGEELFLGDDEHDTVKGKRRHAGSEKQSYTTDKRIACGFRNKNRFITSILFRLENLDIAISTL
jgi:hypothetical protein